MIGAAELIEVLRVTEDEPDADSYDLALDDAAPIIAVSTALAALDAAVSGAPVDLGDAEALAEHLEGLVGLDEGAATVSELTARFRPFLLPQDALGYLDDHTNGRVSREIGQTDSFGEAVAATWAAPAARIARSAAAGLPLASQDRLQREIVAVCGLCSVPVALLVLSLDYEASAQLLTGSAQAVDAIRRRLRARPGSPSLEHVHAELDRLLRSKQAQIRTVVGELPAPAQPDARGPERFAALPLVGALLELRAESEELTDDLAATSIATHRLLTPAAKLGLMDAVLIDQNPRLAAMRALQPKVDAWITEALGVAGRDPGHKDLAQRVDLIALSLGAMRTLLSMVQVSERVIDDTEQPDLWKALEDSAITLDTALVLLTLKHDRENLRQAVTKASEYATVLVASYRWSRIVLQAMRDATEVILSLETGGRMGGVGPALQSQMAVTGSSTATRIITAAELDRLLAGATIVAMAAADPQKSRRKGIKAEKGLKLSPNRPREDVGSILGTATARYPDNLLVRFKTFWEVKNVLRLRLTRQMVDFLLFAQASRLKMILYIRPKIGGKGGTTLAPSLKAAIKLLKSEVLIEIRYLKKGKY